MAPRKRKVEEGGGDNGKSKTTALSTRVTRSMAHGSSSGPAAVAKVASKKQTGKATKKNKAKETNKEAEEEEDPKAEVGPTQDEEEKGEVEHEEEEEKKTVVVEHCKQCNSFKTRALQVKGGLEKAVPGVNVLLNPDKPRRGCFEIREEGGEKFISLLDMKRPFKQMKDLDMEEVIAEIVDKIKA